MAKSILTPLQLSAGSGFLANTALKSLPSALTTAIAAFNALTVISPLNAALNAAGSGTWCSAATLLSLQSLGGSGGNLCYPLGNSIPPSYSTLTPVTNPSGFSGLITQTGNAYLGSGESGKFAQGFLAINGYLNTVNAFITTNVNADNYLGPTFSNMDALTSADISNISPVYSAFGTDIINQGDLVDTKNLDLYGTPAGLIQQLSAVSGVRDQAIPAVQSALISVGLTPDDIRNLVNDNRAKLYNPNGLTPNEFDRLQKYAYDGLTLITGDDLTQALSLLNVTTPNITSLEQLLDPVKVFPLSYNTLKTPSPDGPVFIFDPNGNVNSDIAPIVNSYLPTSTGCDELGKIIPPADAVANKALQVSFQNIPGITNSSWPDLGQAIYGSVPPELPAWTPDQPYLPNTFVAVPDPTGAVSGTPKVPATYQSQQDVPTGIDISNTSYWQPASLGNLVTMDTLTLVQAQTAAVDPSVTSYYDNSVATGTGPYNTITFYDVLGTAIDYNNFATTLGTATTALQAIITAGGAADLISVYTAMKNAAENANAVNGPVVVPPIPAVGYAGATYNKAFPYFAADLALQALIPYANTAIAAIVANASYTAYCTTASTAFNTIAATLTTERGYQTAAGVDYFQLLAGEKASVYALIQTLPSLAENATSGSAYDFLTQITDLTTLGGQSTVGTLRQATNSNRLRAARLSEDATQIPQDSVPAGGFVFPTPKAALYDNYPKNRNEIP